MKIKFKDITRNTLAITFGQGLGYIFNFFSFVLIARYLTVSDFGKFSFLVAFVSIVSKFIDFGFVPIVFREYSVKKNNKLLNTAFTLRTLLFVGAVLIVNLGFYILNYNLKEIIYLNILFLSIIISSRAANFRELLTIPFKSELKMHIPMLINILDNIVFLILVVLMPVFNADLMYLITAYVFVNLPGFILMLFLLFKKYNYKITFHLNKAKWLLHESLPLAGFVLIIVLFQQVDIVLLKYFSGENEVAIFSAALRFIMPLNIIPIALSSTAFPLLMKNIDNQIYLKKLIEIVNKFLFLSAIIIGFFLIIKSNDIITMSLGNKYTKSAVPFNLMMISRAFMFVNYFSLSVFTAHKKQIWNLYYAILLFATNFIFDILLIPTYSFNGAAAAKLIAGIFGFGFILYKLYKLNFHFFLKGYKIVGWVIFLFVGGFTLSYLPWFVYFIVFPVFIIFSIIVFRMVNLDEVEIVLKLFNREKLTIYLEKYFH